MIDSATRISGRFYGVYLLCSQSLERHQRGKCYIGFTVNPDRRLRQHNEGCARGGAHKTNNRGPWQMVLIVHGFPTKNSAMQFEWAWQNPRSSSRLNSFKELYQKQRKETWIAYNLRILKHMLLVGPWTRMPLVVRWLESAYKFDFARSSDIPAHMTIESGKILIVRAKKGEEDAPCIIWAPECHLCGQRIETPERSRIGCLNRFCKLTCHLVCLANILIAADERDRGHFIPIAGECPLCSMIWTWSALVDHKRKIDGLDVDEEEQDDEDDEDFQLHEEQVEEETETVDKTLELVESNDDQDQRSTQAEQDIIVLSD